MVVKYVVNEDCIGCGLCTSICPEVFEMTDAGVAKAQEEPVAEAMDPKAQDALNSCPVSAILAE